MTMINNDESSSDMYASVLVVEAIVSSCSDINAHNRPALAPTRKIHERGLFLAFMAVNDDDRLY